jgi:hypothetical protein
MLLQQELALESGTDLDDRPGHDLAMQTARSDNAKRKGRQPETNEDR